MMRVLKILVACVALAASAGPSACLTEFDVISNVLGRSVSVLAGQQFAADDQVPGEFGEYALRDESNENMGHSTPQEMIAKAGYESESHYVVSDDGYVTLLVRVINPLADQSQLKQPPVVLLQGGITDITIWIWGSISQHHPEKYPRTVEDGPITSWNRSLAFALSNNGYDVWLVSHRGSNEQNWGHINLRNKHKLPGRRYMASNSYNETYLAGLSAAHGKRSIADMLRFWDFSFDEVANYETPRHLDYILSHTKSANITLVPMSYSTIYAAMTLSKHPQYLRKLHNVVIVGPIINNIGSNRVQTTFHNTFCRWMPLEMGTVLVTEILFSQVMRNVNLAIANRKDWRYSIMAPIYTVLIGPSSRYQTLYESAVLGHVLMPTGFKMIKHWCQIVTQGKFKKFDYGPALNKKHYGDFHSPHYDMDLLQLGNWMAVSGANDVLATVSSAKQYINHIRPKPHKHIEIKGYNHLDLWAGSDNDIRVNLPIMEFIEKYHIPPKEFA